MLKKLGLNHQLQGLTVFFTVSILVFLNGCAIKSKMSKTFYPEYYAARKLQNQDIVKLRELTVNPDLFIADSATLLLGSYYLYYGDKNYGKLLIDKSYNSKNLDEEMTIFGQLWKMEALLREGERGVAINMANNIREMRRTPVYMRVMQIYCNQLGVLVIGDGEINTCLDRAIKGKEKFKEIATDNIKEQQELPIMTDNMTYEEYLNAMGIGGAVNNIDAMEKQSEIIKEINIKSDAKINLVGGDIFDDVAAGMIYGMGRYNNNYQLEPISDFAADEESKTDMLLRLNTLDLYMSGYKTNLNVDWLQLSEIAGNLKIVNNKSTAVIITSELHEAHGKIIADTFKSVGKKAHIVKTSSRYQVELQNILQSQKNKSYVMIIMADEKEILDIIPIAKYWQVNSTLQDILVITSYIPEFNISDDQSSYFKGVYILTSAFLANDEEYIRVSNDYKGFYGVPMSGKSALGYDIITYINNIVNKNEKGKYVTNINEIVNGYAIRTPVLLYADGNKLIEKEKFEQKIEEGVSSLPK